MVEGEEETQVNLWATKLIQKPSLLPSSTKAFHEDSWSPKSMTFTA